MELEEDEIYSIFKSSPLLTEATKVILEAEGTIGLTEIAEKLGKKPPTVHGALQKLRNSKILLTTKMGRNVAYNISPTKKTVVERIVSRVYHPTDSYVIGMLKRHEDLPVNVFEDMEFEGRCFVHIIPMIYERVSRTQSNGNSVKGQRVGIDVLATLSDEDIMGLAGRLFDLQHTLNGYVFAVIENGVSQETFTKLEGFINVIRPKLKTRCVLIKKSNPVEGVRKVRRAALGMLQSIHS